jgi:putative DNA primase/helicase
MLGVVQAGNWRDFVSFVSSQDQVCPNFSGDPRPLTVDLLPVPPLEDVMIPTPLRAWVLDIATRAWALVEYPTAAAIVALGGLIGRRIGIKPKRQDDWLVVPNVGVRLSGRQD